MGSQALVGCGLRVAKVLVSSLPTHRHPTRAGVPPHNLPGPSPGALCPEARMVLGEKGRFGVECTDDCAPGVNSGTSTQ